MNVQSQRESLIQSVESHLADGKTVKAINALKRGLKEDPNFYQAWLRLSRILFDTENYREAVHIGRAAERFDPLQSAFGDIQRHMQRRRLSEAEAVARNMLAQQPGHPRAIFTIAEIARQNADPEGMVRILESGLQQAPASPFLQNMLIGAHDAVGDFRAAIEAAQTLVLLEPSFTAYWTLVGVLLRHGQNQEALAACDQAARLCKDEPTKLSEVDLVRGQILRVLGQQEESLAAYRSCLDHNPRNAAAWWALADLKTLEFSAADVSAIRALTNDSTLSQRDKSMSLFALAKASEREADWDRTMSLYEKANKLHAAAVYDPRAFKDEVDRYLRACDEGALSQQGALREGGPTPIFILGLPRAGSTLIEQILASHSLIEGTIEQPVMPSIARQAHIHCVQSYQGSLLEKMGKLSEQELSEFGDAYLTNGTLFRSEGTPYFTDKLPFNFRHIGLIHKTLPQAIIIDARRNPLDCGFSLYKQHFPTGVEFSYGLSHIGAFYNDYLRLMDHWHTVLPGRVLTVQYERLVRDPEPAIRTLLDHVGVPFESACLDFHQTQRAVRTASSEQVRQPINTRGIGAWRKVEAHLEPLKAALGAATLARFDGLYDA